MGDCRDCTHYQVAKTLCQREPLAMATVEVIEVCIRRDDKFPACSWERFKGDCGADGKYFEQLKESQK